MTSDRSLASGSAATVLGLDVARGRWVGALWDGHKLTLRSARAAADLIPDRTPEVIAVDIPIGLPDRSRREADLQGRRLLGPRASTLFITPVRDAVEAADYQSALRINRELTGHGISVQAFGLRHRTLEIDRLRRLVPATWREVHPEIAFTQLNGDLVLEPKRSAAGSALRRSLLARAGFDVPEALRLRGCGSDDLLDAAVVALTAARILAGQAQSVPSPPEFFGDGHPAAIWY